MISAKEAVKRQQEATEKATAAVAGIVEEILKRSEAAVASSADACQSSATVDLPDNVTEAAVKVVFDKLKDSGYTAKLFGNRYKKNMMEITWG